MKLYVIRHGETQMGKNGIIATEDEPLNEFGIKQAKEIGDSLKTLDIDLVYCSPIERAKQTLELFNLDKDIPVIIEERIKERNMGNYEKVYFKELDWNAFWNYNSDIKYPDLESMKDVYNRVKNFIDEIKKQNKNILLVTHGGISRAIYWYFNGIPIDGNSANVNENCKIYEYEIKLDTK